jgi:hypothetical protein
MCGNTKCGREQVQYLIGKERAGTVVSLNTAWRDFGMRCATHSNRRNGPLRVDGIDSVLFKLPNWSL